VAVGAAVASVEVVEVYFDGFVGVSAVFGGAEGADEGVVVALPVQTDQVYLLSRVPGLLAVDVFYDVARNLRLHSQRYISNIIGLNHTHRSHH
jgi:hypothetical protein